MIKIFVQNIAVKFSQSIDTHRKMNQYPYIGFILFLSAVPLCFPNHKPHSSIHMDICGHCVIAPALRREIRSYAPTVQRIIDSIVGTDAPFAGDTWRSCNDFVDKFGPRPTGSPALAHSIAAVLSDMRDAGLENVHAEPVIVSDFWERGHESAELLQPFRRQLRIAGLGTSVGTDDGATGIVADVLTVETFTEFDRLNDDVVCGKIVLFAPQWTTYPDMLDYREHGAAVAAAKGAVAVLVRSLTPVSLGLPHTGLVSYRKGIPKIPAAAVTVEDAQEMLRLCRQGRRVRVRLQMGARTVPGKRLTHNVIAELQGSRFPAAESVCVVSGHLDSWDLGQGAQDDAAGAFAAWKAVEYLRRLGLRARRTIRAILWTDEEQQYAGVYQYREAHRHGDANEFNFMMESDMGTFEPFGLELWGSSEAKCLFAEIVQLLRPLNVTELREPAESLADVEVGWKVRGIPMAGPLSRNERYYWYHHSTADTMQVVDSGDLDRNTALFAAVAFVVADLSVNVPRK